MALLEAQAAGLPVVAGRSGGVSSIVAHGEAGLLTTEGDAAAFADAVRLLLTHPQRRSEMSEAAMRKAARKHDIAIASALLDCELRTLVAERTA
jgi:glycosyltransferase involved in cell wall biosynthesis